MTAARPHVAAALVACAALVILAWLASPRITRQMPDFEVYWTAAARAAAAEPLYRIDDGHYQFKYLPAFAILAAPLAALPLPTAKTAWFLLSAALLPVLLSLALALLPTRRKPAWMLVTLTVVVMGKFYGHELVLGQVNILFAVIVTAALLGLRHGRETAAGLLVAMAIVIKPYAVLFLPWLLARGRRASVVAVVAGLVAAFLLPMAVYGPGDAAGLHADWWRTVSESTSPNLTNNDNVSFAGLFAKWLGPGPVAVALTGAASLALLASAVVVFLLRSRVAFPEGLEGALLLTSIPLVSPQGWDYVFLLSTPAILWLVNDEDRLPQGLRGPVLLSLPIIGLTLFDIMGRAAYGAFMAWSILTICYAVVVAGLVALRARGVA